MKISRKSKILLHMFEKLGEKTIEKKNKRIMIKSVLRLFFLIDFNTYCFATIIDQSST